MTTFHRFFPVRRPSAHLAAQLPPHAPSSGFRKFASAARSLAALAAVTVGATLFSGCFDDGPNQTGLSYASRGQDELRTPLERVVFENFPLDSAFLLPYPLARFGDTTLLLGRDSLFTSEIRLGYRLTSSNFKKKIAAEDGELRLNLHTLTPYGEKTFFRAGDWDSLVVRVESFTLTDTVSGYGDSLSRYHSLLMVQQIPFAALDSQRVTVDTLVLRRSELENASGIKEDERDPLSYVPSFHSLPHLLAKMKTETEEDWALWLRLSVGTEGEGPGFLRFQGQTSSTLGPHLTALAVEGDDETPTPRTLSPYLTGSPARQAVLYKPRYLGTARGPIFGAPEALHLRLDRDRLLDSLRARLGDRARPGGGLDIPLFVSFATLTAPLNLEAARGLDHASHVEFEMISDVDSVIGGEMPDEAWITLETNEGSRAALSLLPFQGSSDPEETLNLSYESDSRYSGGRMLILDWDGERYDDTVYIESADTLEFSLRKRPLRIPLNFIGEFTSQKCRLLPFHGTRAASESRQFLDPESGADITLYSAMPQRFLSAGDESLTLRATRGIRNLLQSEGAGNLTDLAIRPTGLALTEGYRRIDIPVTGEFSLKTTGESATIRLELYLYPLSRSE